MAKLGIKFPDTDSLPIEDTLEMARLADAAGFDSLWMSDYKSGDPFAVLAACAVVTERILLAPGVAVIFNRAPTTLAMAAASVDTISKGRFVLGIGQGHRAIVEDENGLTFDNATARMVEYTAIVRALIRDGEVQHRGRYYTLGYKPWVKMYRDSIPIWYPPMFPASAARTGALADGAVGTQLTAARAGQLVQWVKQGAAEAGRDPAEVEVGSYLLTVVTNDKQAGRAMVKRHMAWYVGTFTRYEHLMAESGFEEAGAAARAWRAGDQARAARLLSDELADSVAIIGDIDDCRGRIQEYRDAGLEHPIIYPMPMTERETKQAFLDAVQLIG